MDTLITNVTAVTMTPGAEVLFGVNIGITDGKIEFISKKVPEDLSVTGYDDSMIARTGPVELTTVSHPQEKLGEMAAELLLELLHGVPAEESKVRRLIEPELVIRKSCMERK